MVKKSNQKKKKERFDFKKFWNNWNGFDSFFSFISGSALSAITLMLFDGMYTIPKIIIYIRPFVVPMILMVVFSYCMKNAFKVMQDRKYPLIVKTGWQGFYGNLISIGWIAGGLFFIASSTPEIWAVIVEWASKK